MDPETQYQLKIVGDQDLVAEVQKHAREHPDELEILASEAEEDPTRLGFDLVTISAVVTIVSGSLYVGELAGKLLKWVRESRSKKVVIQTPFRTLELRGDNLTEEDVRKALQFAQEVL